MEIRHDPSVPDGVIRLRFDADREVEVDPATGEIYDPGAAPEGIHTVPELIPTGDVEEVELPVEDLRPSNPVARFQEDPELVGEGGVTVERYPTPREKQ